MKKDFIELLKEDLDQKYLNHINFIESDKEEKLKNAFQKDDLLEREKLIRDKVLSSSDLIFNKKLANPFYIGFGNPNSKILFIGKEKAFSSDNLDLLIKESINNYAQWKQILSSNSFDFDQLDICKNLGFSPLLPKAYYLKKTNSRHTWGIISEIVNRIYNPNKKLNENQYLKNSIFDYCFLTELNHIPSKYNEGSGLSKTRKQFLSNNFYKTFPIVIIGAKSYLKQKEASEIKDIFNAEYLGDIDLAIIGKKKPRTLYAKKYKSDCQTIYVCDQLSGMSGWSIPAIEKFADEITGGNIG